MITREVAGGRGPVAVRDAVRAGGSGRGSAEVVASAEVAASGETGTSDEVAASAETGTSDDHVEGAPVVASAEVAATRVMTSGDVAAGDIAAADDPRRLIGRFVAYRVALEAFRLTVIASKRWVGFGELRAQAIAAAGSVAQNLAEGNGFPPRSAARRRHQRIALGSALELESTLDLAVGVGAGRAGEVAAAREAAGRAARLCTGLCR